VAPCSAFRYKLLQEQRCSDGASPATCTFL
jgi:hypothetical protein